MTKQTSSSRTLIAKRLGLINESPTLAISAKAKELQKQGKPVVDFGAGQLDFEIPDEIKEGITAALNTKGIGKYTAVAGMPELRQAICKMFAEEYNITYTPQHVMVTTGGKQAINNLMQAIINKGDEVIIPKPYWVSYPEMVNFAEGTSVFADTDESYHIKADLIKEKVTKNTKLIIINSPSNPSGAVIDDKELKKVADIALENDIYVMSDEVYSKLLYDKKFTSIASLSDEMKAKTFVTSAFSKTFAIPGWRLGYLAGPIEVINACTVMQSQSTSNASSLIQQGVLNMMDKKHDFLKDWMIELRKRRDFITKRLNEIEGVHCPEIDGAFYAFPKIPFKDDFKFSNDILNEAFVAIVPGQAFGSPGHIRISFACSQEKIETGLNRIEEFIKSSDADESMDAKHEKKEEAKLNLKGKGNKRSKAKVAEEDAELEADLAAIRRLAGKK